MTWLANQKPEHAEQRIAFEEMLLAVREAQARVVRLEQAIRAALPDRSLVVPIANLIGWQLIENRAMLLLDV